MKLREAFHEAKWRLLQMEEESEAEADARVLMEGALREPFSYYVLHQEEDMAPDQEQTFKKLIGKRLMHEPAAYVLGEWEFMGLKVKVNPSVLIPRQDTETLAEEAIRTARLAMAEKKKRGTGVYKVLDLCTGSGCLAMALCYYLKETNGMEVKVEASDLSEEALDTARENAASYKLPVTFYQGDMWEAVGENRYDLIVCNPPYIASGMIETLEDEVKRFEPYMALCGGQDGLSFYREILSHAAEHLDKGGYLLTEIGDEQGESVPALTEGSGLTCLKVLRDLAGNNRVVKWKRE